MFFTSQIRHIHYAKGTKRNIRAIGNSYDAAINTAPLAKATLREYGEDIDNPTHLLALGPF
jgi:hypothetical protein